MISAVDLLEITIQMSLAYDSVELAALVTLRPAKCAFCLARAKLAEVLCGLRGCICASMSVTRNVCLRGPEGMDTGEQLYLDTPQGLPCDSVRIKVIM